MVRFTPLAAPLAAALLTALSPTRADACSPVEDAVFTLVEDDTPACLTVRPAPEGAHWLDVVNDCDSDVILSCIDEHCPFGYHPRDIDTYTLDAHTTGSISADYVPEVSFAWTDGMSSGAVRYTIRYIGRPGACDEGCAATPPGRGGSSWMALALLALIARRRRA